MCICKYVSTAITCVRFCFKLFLSQCFHLRSDFRPSIRRDLSGEGSHHKKQPCHTYIHTYIHITMNYENELEKSGKLS